ncbi:oxidoreductase [Flavimobilis marinus]|uniref:Thioredoxin reductase n=1 Tax=Flavimobilis marinus TaxID=285351 RepID=A0A1I2G0H9_9MICO|nr:oxidoreductase [Flavimobilis marinus]SFF10587.1 Thioredoxin reductase [Flavimobilis marinus]
MNQTYDVVVIGGGPAGLSGAVALARARRSVLVIDSGAPRNTAAEHVHGYLGLEGIAPSELLARGRDEVTRYGGEVLAGEVTDVVGPAEASDAGPFTVRLADGRSVEARRLLVATGTRDGLPDIPGLAELWGRDVLHCPYCHGWEARDKKIGVLVTAPTSVDEALLLRQWSDDVTLYTHDTPLPDDAQRARLQARGVRIVEGEVTGVVTGADGRLSGVRLAGDTEHVEPCEALVVTPIIVARAEFLDVLSPEARTEAHDDEPLAWRLIGAGDGATDVPGIWVAGNVAQVEAQVVTSAAMGLRAAVAINADLVREDTDRAVAEQQSGGE